MYSQFETRTDRLKEMRTKRMEIKIIRKIDDLGRIVIPIDIRRHLKLTAEDDIEISVKNGAVILAKAE